MSENFRDISPSESQENSVRMAVRFRECVRRIVESETSLSLSSLLRLFLSLRTSSRQTQNVLLFHSIFPIFPSILNEFLPQIISLSSLALPPLTNSTSTPFTAPSSKTLPSPSPSPIPSPPPSHSPSHHRTSALDRTQTHKAIWESVANPKDGKFGNHTHTLTHINSFSKVSYTGMCYPTESQLTFDLLFVLQGGGLSHADTHSHTHTHSQIHILLTPIFSLSLSLLPRRW